MYQGYFNTYTDFQPLENPIELDDGNFKIVGLFPYRTASIEAERIPSFLFKSISDILIENRLFDNKIVVAIEDQRRYSGEHFIIQFHDSNCRVGTWNDLRSYGGGEKLKK